MSVDALPSHDASPAHDTARVLRVAMRTGVAMLMSGAQTDEVEVAIPQVAAAFGVVGVQASVTFSTISVSYDARGLDHPTTLLHLVRERTSDFARLAGAATIVRRVRAAELDLDGAEAALDELERGQSAYGRLVNFVAPGVSAAGSTIVFGGNVLDGLSTFAIALVVQPTLVALDRSTLPPFFRFVFGAFASTVLVALLVGLGLPIVGGLVLTGSLLRFLPGYALVSGFRDLVGQSVLSGTARLAEALLIGSGVAAGTAAGLGLAGYFNVRLTLVTVGPTDWGLVVAAVAAFVAVGAFAVRLGVPRGYVASAALLGAVAWISFIALAEIGIVDRFAAILGASIAIGVVGRLLAQRFHAPAALWIVPAVLPLLPGLQIVQAMLANTDAARIGGLLSAAGTAFLIGTGVASGDIIVSTIRRLRYDYVNPAVDMVASGVGDFIVTPVGRVVDQVVGHPEKTDKTDSAD